MKRRIVLASAVVLLAFLVGCGRALPAPARAESDPKPYPIKIEAPAPETQKPMATPLPTATPMATIDAPWYRDRNEQLRQLIRNYRPSATEAEIDQAIARMAIDPNKPMVALTFDDGPKPGITDKILDVLEQYNARATFFVLGWRFGLLVFVLDALKGLAAVSIGMWLGGYSGLAAAALGVIIGHDFPVLLKFRGGKGIASSTGILMGLFPVPTLIGVLVFLLVVRSTRMVSLGSLVFVLGMALYAVISGQPAALALLAVSLALFAFIRHRENIRRILAGQENMLSY